MFYLIGIVVTFFLAVLLVTKRGKTGADLILAVWLFAIGVHLTSFYLFVTGIKYSFPFLLGIEGPFPLVHGPLLYLYTAALTRQQGKLRHALLHFIPFLASYSLYGPFIMSSSEHKIFVYQHQGVGYENITGFMMIAIIITGIVYTALCLRLLSKHERIIHNQFSYAEKINLAWLRYLIYGIGVIWLIVMMRHDPAIYSAVVVYVILLGYFGINQVGIFTQRLPDGSSVSETQTSLGASLSLEVPVSPEIPASGEPQKLKYLKSSLREDAAEGIHTLLTQSMNERKLFTNPELTLADLADALNVHPNNLSQVINTYEQKTFYDYINLKRVEEFKRIVSLPESQKFTLLGLAQNCGFNSKTSFNRNFKNATGLSPSEYLKHADIPVIQ